MTRSEFDDIRAFITATETRPAEVLRLSRTLLDDLEHARMRETTLRTYYLRLLTAARATVAAEASGAPDPLTFLRDELAKWGQLPRDGEEVHRVLSDARATAALAAGVEKTSIPAISASRRGHRRVRVSRTVQR